MVTIVVVAVAKSLTETVHQQFVINVAVIRRLNNLISVGITGNTVEKPIRVVHHVLFRRHPPD